MWDALGYTGYRDSIDVHGVGVQGYGLGSRVHGLLVYTGLGFRDGIHEGVGQKYGPFLGIPDIIL